MTNLSEYIFFRLTLVHNMVVSGNTVYVNDKWLKQVCENAVGLCSGNEYEAIKFVCRRIIETTGADYMQFDIENTLTVNLKSFCND